MRNDGQALRPDLNLLIYDAARPLSVQRQMWDMVKGTEMRDFVANPNNGPGMHNFGAAVDLTLMDCTGQPLPMGSGFDYFGDESRTTDEQTLVDEGRITPRELENRLLLRRVMTEAGFTTITEEWWHFNIMPTEKAAKYSHLLNKRTSNRKRTESDEGYLFARLFYFQYFI